MPMSRSEAGRLGGQATYRKHGSAHMQRIGRLGFKALATFARGGRSAALAKLASWGKMTPHHPIDRYAEHAFEALYESIVGGPRDDGEIPY